jgi:hypothetical protein
MTNKSLKGFGPMTTWRRLMAVSLNCGPVARDFRRHRIQEFRPVILSIDMSNGY